LRLHRGWRDRGASRAAGRRAGGWRDIDNIRHDVGSVPPPRERFMPDFGAPRREGDTMKAIRYYRYGSPDVLQLHDVEARAVGENDVLVRVRAAATNPLDFHYMRGTPYLMRPSSGLTQPKNHGLGADMAGVVEAVGPRVTKFRPGDEVFGGGRDGTFAEY